MHRITITYHPASTSHRWEARLEGEPPAMCFAWTIQDALALLILLHAPTMGLDVEVQEPLPDWSPERRVRLG